MAAFFEKQHASRNGVSQTIAFDGSVAATNAFGAHTHQIRLSATSACVYIIGDGAQTAVDDNTGVFLPANTIEYVTVSPGQRISAIKKGTNGLVNATVGTLWVTELS